MNKKKWHILLLIVTYTSLISFIGSPLGVFAADGSRDKGFISMTDEEYQYIKEYPVVDVLFITGIAPYIYIYILKMERSKELFPVFFRW